MMIVGRKEGEKGGVGVWGWRAVGGRRMTLAWSKRASGLVRCAGCEVKGEGVTGEGGCLVGRGWQVKAREEGRGEQNRGGGLDEGQGGKA